MHVLRTAVVLATLVLPFATLAAGGHDSIGCGGCHTTHAAKGATTLFAVTPNTVLLNPKTKQPYGGSSALCLGCHAESDKGGQGYAPISAHLTHPFGLATVNAKKASVPADLLREGGRFECNGCHDPHPSNLKPKYLRVDIGAKGENLDVFCATCHQIQADPASAKKASAPAAAKPATKG
jgi:predicted CXXCH cytochrome family protein